MPGWKFVTNHALVLRLIAQQPRITGREISATIGITEKATRGIISDLEADGYVRLLSSDIDWEKTQNLPDVFLVKQNFPNPEIRISSPLSSPFLMISRRFSSISTALFLVNPVLDNSPIISDFVSVI